MNTSKYGWSGRIVFFFISAFLGFGQQAVAEEAPGLSFQVERYVVIGAIPFNEQQVNEVLSPYLGEHSGLEGLQAAGDALESALRDQGYAFFQVSLPPQKLTGGVVSLEVVQQRIGTIQVEGQEHYTQANILRSLPSLTLGLPPNTRKISRSVALANENPSRQVKVSFKAGGQAGELDVGVKVKDARQWNVFTGVSNTGSSPDLTGRWRHTLGYQHNNVWRQDHSAMVSLTYAPDEASSLTQWAASYRIPLYSISSALSLYASGSDIDSGFQGSVGGTGLPGSIAGGGEVAGLRFRHLFLNIGAYKHSASIAYEDKISDTVLQFQFTPQATRVPSVRSTPIKLSYDAGYQYKKNLWSAKLSYLKNLELNNKNDAAAYASQGANRRPDWDVWRLRLTQDVVFSRGVIWRLELAGQHAGEALIGLEQYGVGGINSVRGYYERIAAGDDAYYARNEWWFAPLGKVAIRPIVFFDVGEAKLRSTGVKTPVSGAGVGLRWQWKNRVSAQLDVARAGDTVTDQAGQVLEKVGQIRGHFSLFARF